MKSAPADIWLLLDSGACDYAFNMALDETLLELAPEINHPILRFYGWTQPAASFGYFQKISEIERATPLRPLVRRPTGGGLVPHDADWTYSVIIPPTHDWYKRRALESYENIHVWIQTSFALVNVAVELAPNCRKELPGQCFAGYEKSDVLRLGRKIAGAAQRRTKAGLLIQGSIQPPPSGVSRSGWQEAMQSAGRQMTKAQWQPFVAPEAVMERAFQFAAGKFSRDDYNRRR